MVTICILGVPLSPSFRDAKLLLARNDRGREHRGELPLPHISDQEFSEAVVIPRFARDVKT